MIPAVNSEWRSEQSSMGKCMLKALDTFGELVTFEFSNICPGTTHAIHMGNLKKRGLIRAERLEGTRTFVWMLTPSGQALTSRWRQLGT